MRPARHLALAAAGSLALAGLGAVPAQAQSGDADVTVIHGVALPAAATVDVWAGDTVLLEDLAYQDIEKTTVPAGDYDLYVTAPDAADTSGAIITLEGATVPAGADVTIVAHQSESGDPLLTPFVNDTEETAAGTANLFIRHTAAAPAVDVVANGSVTLAEGLTNPNEAAAKGVDAGSYDVEVQAGGAAVPGLSADGVALDAGTAYFVYAVGNADDGYALVVDSTEVGAAGGDEPSSVPAGSDGSGAPAPYVALLLVAGGAALLGAGALRVARR